MNKLMIASSPLKSKLYTMKIKELLLNGNSFPTLLTQLSMKVEDVHIKDEELILFGLKMRNQDTIKENICIEGKNQDGEINLYGTLHFNLLNQLAVFEMQGYEKVN